MEVREVMGARVHACRQQDTLETAERVPATQP